MFLIYRIVWYSVKKAVKQGQTPVKIDFIHQHLFRVNRSCIIVQVFLLIFKGGGGGGYIYQSFLVSD